MYPGLKPETGGWSFHKLSAFGETNKDARSEVSYFYENPVSGDQSELAEDQKFELI